MGDFNSTPESALYHYLSTGRLDLAETDRRNMSGQMEGVFHSGRPWQPYRPSTRISIPEQLLNGSEGHDNLGGKQSTSDECEGQVETAPSSTEARELPGNPRDPDQLEERFLEALDRSASPVPFGGLSSSLGGALKNETGLELKRARCEEQEYVKSGAKREESDQDRGVEMDCGEEQAAQRRKLREDVEEENDFDFDSEQARDGHLEGGQEGGYRGESAGHAEPLVARQEDSENPQSIEMTEAFSAELREAGATPSITPEEALSGSAKDFTPTTTGRVFPAGPGATWQSQQRSNWGRRRPPGIDYVWDDEEFNIAAGGERDSVVRHPLEGMKSAYAAVRQPRFRGEPVRAREPTCTTFHGKAQGTVDYIWFTRGLHPVRVLDTLPMQSLQHLRGLPTEQVEAVTLGFCLSIFEK